MDFSNPVSEAARSAGVYTRQLLDLLGDRDPIDVQRELVTWLRDAVDGMDGDRLRRREAPGNWSVLEVIRHLAETELVYRYRMRKSVAQPGEPIAGYDQDRWVVELRYTDDSLDDSLAELQALRSANLAWLEGLTPEELGRAGIHEERGPESVEHIVRLLAAHDLVHRAQIERIKDATL
jgi:uncharacterized damage-inducible protein DinB